MIGLSNCAATFALTALLLVASCFGTKADALADLNRTFRDAYGMATAQSLTELRRQVPIFVNRFGQIALYRPGVEQPDIFSMDMAIYLRARSVAHTVVALNARLVPFGLGPLDDERLRWLVTYGTLLAGAIDEISERHDLPEAFKADQLNVLSTVRRAVQRIHQRGEIDQAVLDEVGVTVRPSLSRIINTAATSQLDQFRSQIARWKGDYPDLAWHRAVAVVIGIHQARENYLQRQFFDWLLDDRPSQQERVIFAETLAFPPSLETTAPTDAMMLLAKVMLDKTISVSVFGDALALQSDVLGQSASQIIRLWPPP